MILGLDPLTLQPTADRWPAPREQSVGWVVAAGQHAWRDGAGSVRLLLPAGHLGPSVGLGFAESIGGAVAYGDGQLLLTTLGRLVVVSPDGSTTTVRRDLQDCSRPEVNGRVAWLSCDNGLVTVHLPRAPG